MERPPADTTPKQRTVTGEIVYLDTMRRQRQVPEAYLDLSDLAIQMYEEEAAMYPDGTRPDIMDAYEQYDDQPSDVVASCRALADVLLELKDAKSPLTFVDIVVEAEPEAILDKLAAMRAGSMLAADDEQLAIPSNGEYYPILDARKEIAKLTGAGLRVWGWDYPKHVFTNPEGKKYEYPDDMLVYPAGETSPSRQLELTFGYCTEDGTRFNESVSMYIHAGRGASIGSQIWMSAYAETGYEGHGGKSMEDVTDADIAAFGDLVAEIVGDNPISIAMRTDQQLQELTNNAATPAGQQAVRALVELTWPAQANYFLNRQQEGQDQTIAELLRNEATADEGRVAIDAIMAEWNARRQKTA